MQAARSAGLLEGNRGRYGGYRLAKEPSDITLGDVYRVCSEINYGMRGDGVRGDNSDWPSTAIGFSLQAVLLKADGRMMAELDAVTLQDCLDAIKAEKRHESAA